MKTRYPVRPAVIDDLPAIIGLIDSASAWLRTKGTDQWATPWPSVEGRRARVREAIGRGVTWLMADGPEPVATISFDCEADPKLWRDIELGEPAVYLHRLIINRRYAGAGIGAEVLEWAIERAYRESEGRTKWARIDVWTTNHGLHEYYRKIGFELVRNRPEENPGHPSCALFQKAVHGNRDNARAEYPTPYGIVEFPCDSRSAADAL